MNVESFDTLMTTMKNCMSANQSKITDFNEGSIINTLFEAFARIIEIFYIDTRNGYKNNLKAIPYSVFGFKRKEGTKAVGKVVFSRAKVETTSTTIPTGTEISADGLIFRTTQVGTIAAGQLQSGKIDVEAKEIGNKYNVNANSINTIETMLSSDVVEVNNELRCYGGSDEENDADMLARFKTYINGLQGTNYYGLKSNVLNLAGVRSCSIDEHFPPAYNQYNATVYIDDGTGNMTDELKSEVENVIYGSDTDSNPGSRAAGVNIRIAAASPIAINVKCTCTIYRTEDSKAVYEIQQALEEEINSLGINEKVVLTSLILRLRRISYVRDVSNLEINGNKENQEIGVNQIARCGTLTISIINENV